MTKALRAGSKPRGQAGPAAVDASRPANGLSGVRWLQAAVIVAAVVLIYGPVLEGGWLMDDVVYIPQNRLLRDGAGLWKIWFEPGSFIEYYPLKASVEWIEWNIFGNDTRGYHLTNLALHAGNALLAWRLFARLGLRRAWLGGLIFAIHPAMVESVAWISELKNTLSLLPFLLAMSAWIDYEERGRPRDYLRALGCFTVAMLCKISVAPFPAVMLLYAWWKRGRIRWNDFRASAPFFAVALALGMLSMKAGASFQRLHMPVLDPVPMGGFFSRLAGAGLALSHYVVSCLWPVNLTPFYPRWSVDPSSVWQFLPWVVFGGIVYGLWRQRRSWGRHALLGLGFFTLNLAPFLGFVAASYMSFTWVMDHFLYLPILGLIGLGVAGIAWMEVRLSPALRRAGIAAGGLVLGLLALESRGYATNFVDEETLAAYALRLNPGAWTARNSLGNALEHAGHPDAAAEQFEAALRTKPDYIEARYNLGNALLSSGRYEDAIGRYREVLRTHPRYPKAHNNIAVALTHLGRFPEAIAEMEAELQLYPDDAAAQRNLALIEALARAAPAPH